MKKIILLIAMGYAAVSQAQVSKYTFTKETGQLLEIINYPDIVITNHTVSDDAVLPAKIAIGFPFKFNGVLYDSVNINENGFVWFGNEDPAVMDIITKPISAQLSPKVKGVICAVCDDLHPHVNSGLTTTIKSGVGGTAPMRELIIEWQNTARWESLFGGEDSITFQIKLYEFINRIEVAYGHIGLNDMVSTQVEVGLRGPQANDFNNRMTTDATHDWKNSLKGTTSASTCTMEKGFQPAYGDLYVWMNLNQDPDPTSVSEVINGAAKVYPVPAGNELFVETESAMDGTIEISDLAGRTVKSAAVSGLVTRVITEDLQAGIYIVSLRTTSQEVVLTNRIAISR